MEEKDYITILNRIEANQRLAKIMKGIIHYSPYPDVMIYIVLLVSLMIQQDAKLIPCTLIPASILVITTILRKLFNSPRPYDLYAIEPLDKHSSGESFPSRHTASAFAIGYCCLYYSFPLGMITLIFAIIVAITRIMGALHFPKDVLAGFLLATLISLFYLL